MGKKRKASNPVESFRLAQKKKQQKRQLELKEETQFNNLRKGSSKLVERELAKCEGNGRKVTERRAKLEKILAEVREREKEEAKAGGGHRERPSGGSAAYDSYSSRSRAAGLHPPPRASESAFDVITYVDKPPRPAGRAPSRRKLPPRPDGPPPPGSKLLPVFVHRKAPTVRTVEEVAFRGPLPKMLQRPEPDLQQKVQEFLDAEAAESGDEDKQTSSETAAKPTYDDVDISTAVKIVPMALRVQRDTVTTTTPAVLPQKERSPSPPPPPPPPPAEDDEIDTALDDLLKSAQH